MEKSNVYSILKRFTEHTVPSKYRSIIRNWLTAGNDFAEKEAAMHRIWMETQADADITTRRSLRQTMQKIQRAESRPVSISLPYRLLRYAAILILPLIVGIGVGRLTKHRYAEPEMIECYVPHGQQKTVRLPDGSVIQVNSGSLLVYPGRFPDKKRSVYLSGEANFCVAKNTRKPFVVSAGPVKVEVLGTKFNIESYPETERVITTLENGSVKVYTSDAPEKALLMRPDEQVVYNRTDRSFSINRVKAGDFSVWTQGELRFVNQPLPEIIAVMERKYNVRIKLSPEISSSDLFTMKFKRHETIEDAMQVFIRLAGNIDYRREGKEILLFKKGKEVKR